jgi:hypothetical protein
LDLIDGKLLACHKLAKERTTMEIAALVSFLALIVCWLALPATGMAEDRPVTHTQPAAAKA